MRLFSRLGIKEIFVGSVIFVVAMTLMYGAMVKPYNYDWEAAGYQTATIETIFPYQNVLGPKTMKALIKVDDGRSATVTLPMLAYLDEGVTITVSVSQAKEDPTRRVYTYAENK